MQPPACGSWRNRQALSCRNWASLLSVRLALASQASSRYGVFHFPLDRQGAALSPFLWVLKVHLFPFSCGSSRYSISFFLWILKVQRFPLFCGSSRYSVFLFLWVLKVQHFPFPVGPQGTAFPFSCGSLRYSVSDFPFWPSANPVLALGVFYG